MKRPAIALLLLAIVAIILFTVYPYAKKAGVETTSAEVPTAGLTFAMLTIDVLADDTYSYAGEPVSVGDIVVLGEEAVAAAASPDDILFVVSVDESASNQAVAAVLDAARRAGLSGVRIETK